MTSFNFLCWECAQLWFLCVSAWAHWRRPKQERSVSCHLRPLLHRLMSLPVPLSQAWHHPREHDDNRDSEWMLEIWKLVSFVSLLKTATHTVPKWTGSQFTVEEAGWSARSLCQSSVSVNRNLFTYFWPMLEKLVTHLIQFKHDKSHRNKRHSSLSFCSFLLILPQCPVQMFVQMLQLKVLQSHSDFSLLLFQNKLNLWFPVSFRITL